MRFAVISDIHSNLEALTEVLRAVEAQKVDRVVSLGDIVGYGASPNPCCELVRNVAEVTLLGNHDAAVAGRMDYSFYYDAARHALDWSASVLSEENHAWLRSLPYTYRIGESASATARRSTPAPTSTSSPSSRRASWCPTCRIWPR